MLEGFRAKGIDIAIEDENQKLDLNAAGLQQLANHFEQQRIATSATLLERVVDFRGGNDEAIEGGSEETLLVDQGISWSPKNAEFQHVYELAQIPDLGAILNDSFLDNVTVFGAIQSVRVITLKIATNTGRVNAGAKGSYRVSRQAGNRYRILRRDWVDG